MKNYKLKIKNVLGRARQSLRAAALIGALCALCGYSASAGSWSIPNPYETNAITWLPQPPTNVTVQVLSVPQHSITVQNFNINSTTNNLTNYFYFDLNGTNQIPYLIASVNGVTSNYGNVYIPTGSNATGTIIFAATNINLYGQSEVLFGTNATGVTNQGAQIITPNY